MPNLRNTALLTSLSIGVLAGRKYDKKETKIIAERTGARVEAIKLNKRLFTESESYQAITAVRSRARGYFNEHSLPWDGEQWRIKSSKDFIEFAQVVRGFESEFYAAVPTFIYDYPALMLRDKAVLNGIWKAEDYPSVDKIKKKFYFKTEVQPIPDASDWRVDVGIEEMAALKEIAEQSVQDRIARSMQEPYHRLFDGVAHMASRLQGLKECPCRACKNKTYSTDSVSDSVVDNLKRICTVLPTLNLTGDQQLADYIEEVEKSLTVFTPEVIRDNQSVRERLIERARVLQDAVGFMFEQAA